MPSVSRLDPRSWDYSPPKWFASITNRLMVLIEKKITPEDQVAWSEQALAKHQRRWGIDSRPAVNLMEAVAHRLDRAGRPDEALILHTSAFQQLSPSQWCTNR